MVRIHLESEKSDTQSSEALSYHKGRNINMIPRIPCPTCPNFTHFKLKSRTHHWEILRRDEQP